MTIEGIWHEETTYDSGSCSAGLLFGFRLGQAKWDTGTWVYCQNASVLGCVIDAVVDPNVLALPPHVTFEQTKNYLAAIRKGDRETAPHVALLKAGVT